MIDYEIKRSLEDKVILSIVYIKGIDIIQRNILVLKIKENNIIAYDLDKKGIRTFKKDNILSTGINLKFNRFTHNHKYDRF